MCKCVSVSVSVSVCYDLFSWWMLWFVVLSLALKTKLLKPVGATLETWLGISGSSLTALDNDPRYPLNPNTTVTLTNLLETATNQADNYGCRLQTYITPPVTCNYTFYMASDDAGELNLSTDTNPSNKARIAYINAWAGSRDWYKYTSQMSAPIHLEKGSLYYLESRLPYVWNKNSQ